ncbi:MAG: hypothetical protein ACJ71N_13110 [Terriglobales bacterium]
MIVGSAQLSTAWPLAVTILNGFLYWPDGSGAGARVGAANAANRGEDVPEHPESSKQQIAAQTRRIDARF